MRWIFLSLLIINALYFYYQWQTGPGLSSQPVAEELPLPVPVPGVASVRLLSEQPQSAASLSADRCYFVGPFNNSSAAQQFLDRMQAVNITAQLSIREAPGALDYWVHLPVQADSQTATSRVSELQALGFESYVIAQGELADAVSLGLFSSIEAAQELLIAVKKQGYVATITELPKNLKQYWLAVDSKQQGVVSQRLQQWQASAAGVGVVVEQCAK